MDFWEEFIGQTPGVGFTITRSFPWTFGPDPLEELKVFMIHKTERRHSTVEIGESFGRTLIVTPAMPAIGQIDDDGVPSGTAQYTIIIPNEVSALFASKQWEYLITYTTEAGIARILEYGQAESVY